MAIQAVFHLLTLVQIRKTCCLLNAPGQEQWKEKKKKEDKEHLNEPGTESLLSFTDTPLSDQTLRGPRDEPSLPECSLVNANNHLGAALNEGGNLVGARKLELNISLRFGSNCCLCLLHSSN